MKALVIGSGFSGAVVARQLAEQNRTWVDVWDQRNHIAGNCHTERDPETKIFIHQYGPHIFNTNSETVWDYVQSFGEFRNFTNRVKAHTSKGIYSLPINLLTLNQHFRMTMNPHEAKAFISNLGDKSIKNPANFEEQALKMLGRDLYETFFKGYTIKQWGCSPRELPASIFQRLPMRFDYNDDYYDKKFQGIPIDGYTEIIRRILDHPQITVHLNKTFDFLHEINEGALNNYDLLIYTGPIDAFFLYHVGRLGYRTVEFQKISTTLEDFQGNAVINYPDISVPWTRIHEHKHFTPWEKHDRTVAFREYSKETTGNDIPYYPKRLTSDMILFEKYQQFAKDLRKGMYCGQTFTRIPPTVFIGRLATYRYMDMEKVIHEALLTGEAIIKTAHQLEKAPCVANEIQ